jgi:hypothetical protein
MAATMAIPENTASPVGLRVDLNLYEDACHMNREDILNSIQKAMSNYNFEVDM